MKSAALLVPALLLGFQSLSYSQTQASPSPTPTVPILSDTQSIDLTQATSRFQLEHIESHPTYTDEQVPSTCYNQVQQGTTQQCETLNDHECTTTDQTQCTNVNNPVCQQVPTQACQNVPSQQCSTVNVPVCLQVPRQDCSTVQQCTTVTDTVCHGNPQVCVDVPRSQCTPTTQCTSVYDTVCHDESQQQCQTVNQQQCSTQYQQQCQDNYQQQCQEVPVQNCTDTPYQSCQTVPNMVSVPYACTIDQSVQTGTQISADVKATVNVILKNAGQIDLSQEQLVVTLSDTDASLALVQSSQKVIFHLIKKDQAVTSVTPVQSNIVATFTLEVFSIDQLNQLSQSKVTNTVLNSDKLLFSVSRLDLSKLPVVFDTGHLKITSIHSGFLGHKSTQTELDTDFDGMIVKSTGTQNEIDFSDFKLAALTSQSYALNLQVGLKLTLNSAELLNPDLLNQVYLQSISGSFAGFPTK